MTYHVLEAVPTGMHAHGYTKLAVVEYNGKLSPDKLKINERFKGLRIVKQQLCNNVGQDTAYKRVRAEYDALVKCLNGGMMLA